MSWKGDYREDDIVYFPFVTLSNEVPTTLAGSPVVSIYKDDETGTEVTTGVTLTVDHDGATGNHNVKIDLSSAAFYATGSDYQARLTAGTVNGVSVVGRVVGEFSINNRRTEDVRLLVAGVLRRLRQVNLRPGGRL